MKRFLLPVIGVGSLILCRALNVPTWILLIELLGLLMINRESPFLLGYFLHGVTGQQGLALRLYHIGLRRGGRTIVPMVDYCALLMQDGQYAQAMILLDELLGMESLNITLNVVCQQYLALACEKTGNLSRAIEIMEEVRREHTCLRSEFYGTLAYFYLEAGEYGRAGEINELARQEDENNASVYDNAALLAYKTGKREDAKELFQKALELDESMLSPKYYLGLLAEDSGDKAVAAGYFRQVWEGKITGLNTISREQAERKRLEYQNLEGTYEV